MPAPGVSLPEVDVLIVGYGPVGATIANLLGRYGLRTLAIDKAPDIHLAPRAIALDNDALRILQLAGLEEGAFPTIAIPHVRMHCPYVGEFARVNTSGSLNGHPKLVTFYQPDLERALREKAARFGSVQFMPSTALTSFAEAPQGVEAELALSDGRCAKVFARYLVGADGAGSVVRKVIGLDFDGKTYAQDWLIVDALDMPRPIDHVEFLCDHRRPTPHMVAPGGRERWEFMLRPGEKREQVESDPSIRALLSPWRQGREIRIERQAVYRFHARACERFSKGRVFLAGDAAHITPPFAGQGLVAGLRDAANLSWKLAWVVKGHAAPAILDSYDQERRPHAKAMIGLAKFLGRMVMPRNAFAAIAVHGAARMLHFVPGMRGYLEELEIKPRNRFAKGLFVAGKRGRLARGDLLPQGLLRAADGRHVQSDDALGQGMTLVGFGLDPTDRLDEATHRRWVAHGGAIVHLCLRGEALHRSERSYEDLGNVLVPDAAPYGWAAVVRPDRTVLHDGPVGDAQGLVEQALSLLGPPRSPTRPSPPRPSPEDHPRTETCRPTPSPTH